MNDKYTQCRSFVVEDKMLHAVFAVMLKDDGTFQATKDIKMFDVGTRYDYNESEGSISAKAYMLDKMGIVGEDIEEITDFFDLPMQDNKNTKIFFNLKMKTFHGHNRRN